MRDQTASRTALATAYVRAAHQLIDSEPLVLIDPVVLTLLGPDSEKRIMDAREKYTGPEARALRSHVVLRSRYAEDRLKLSLERGVRRYLIVGAGFDTFSLRQPAWAGGLKVIEVDHPDTQSLKRAKIAEAGMSVPGNVLFADVDFEKESLEEGLIRNGIGNDEPTFFSWLGVTMYLTEPAIDSTLKCMAKFPKESEAVVTFLQRRSTESTGRSNLARRVSEAGEPFVSFFTPEDFKTKLLAAGFTKVDFLTPELSAHYFDGATSLPNPERISIVSAVV